MTAESNTKNSTYRAVAESDVQQILDEHYDLTALGIPSKIRPLSHLFSKTDDDQFTPLHTSAKAPTEFKNVYLKQNVGGLFLIETTQARYVLKLLAPKRTANQCTIEPHISNWLKNRDFHKVAPVVPAKNGGLLCQWQDRRGTLSAYVPSRVEFDWHNSRLSETECTQSGATLAQLHQHLSELTPEITSAWGLSKSQAPSSVANDGVVGVSSVLPHINAWLAQAFDLVEAGKTLLDSNMKSLLLSQKTKLLLKLDEAKSTIETARNKSDCKEIMVHGDFHPGNLRWSKDGITAVIDFENAHYELPGYDLAYSIVITGSNWQNDQGESAINTNRARALLSGYCKELSLLKHANDKLSPDLLRAQINLAAMIILYWLVHTCRDSAQHLPQLGFLATHFEEFEGLSVV